MITSEYSNQIIKESIQQEKVLNSQRRRKNIQKMLCYYSGENVEEYIQDKFSAKAFQEVPISNYNITKRFIDRMSRIYTLGATRSNGKEYQDLTYLKNMKFKHIEKMTTLLGTLATQIVVREHNGHRYFDYQPIYAFDVHLGDDPFNPDAIIYPLVQNVDDVSYDSVGDLKYVYWDDTMHKIFDKDGNITEAYEHGFGVMPFIFTHREHQLDSFFVGGASDIVNCNEQANILLTEMNLGMRFQMFGQAVITGFYDDQKIQRAGADEVIVLPEGSNYQLVRAGTSVQESIDLLKTMLDLAAQNNHLFVQFAQDGGETPSGIALKIKDISRYEDWVDEIDLWAVYEDRFYALEKQLASLYGINLPEKLNVNFQEPQYPMSVDDQIKLETHELEHNLTTEWKILQKHNQDLTDSVAKKEIETNKEINEQSKSKEEQPQGTQGAFGRLRNGVAETQ